jgi:ferredoxin--NADP+ reductase
MSVKKLNAVLAQKAVVAPGLVIMRVVPDGWSLPEFVPGQFAALGLPGSAPRCDGSEPEEEPAEPDKMVSRAYSIASSPLDRDYLEFYIILVETGGLTPRLLNLEIGDRLWLSPKITGRFTLESIPADANVVLMGTGTGVAPYVSMARTVLGGSDRRLAIVHGCRHSWELGYASELTSMHRINPALTYLPMISRPQLEPIGWTGLTGYVQDVWSKGIIDEKWGFHPTPENTHVLLCGNPAMIEDVEALIQREGFTEHTRKAPGQYHVERYW